jgi:hypothetical protein
MSESKSRSRNQDTAKDGEAEFRLRSRAPKASRSDNQSLTGFRRVMQIFCSSARKAVVSSAPTARAPRFNAAQRCAVRVSYSPNKTKGQWRAHGRYLERDSAVGENKAFDQADVGVSLQERLAEWQTAKDQRLFKLILSPEFGDRLDLQQLTRNFMRRMEDRVATPLEWVAVVHNNTEHPHVHVALRGVAGGEAIRLDRKLVRNGLREEAERLCTLTLGYRMEHDILESQRREVGFSRATSLDRQIQKRAVPAAEGELRFELPSSDREFFQLLASRMAVLSRMGLAQPDGNGWNLRTDYLQVLKSMQQAGDRQKMLHQYGILLSEPRLPTQVTRACDIGRLEGRVLAHVYDDVTGAPQMMLEGTDARVHFIRHTPRIEEMRQDGRLKPNSFVSLERVGEDEKSVLLRVEEFGDAEKYLSSDSMKKSVKKLIQRGIIPVEQDYAGWLGRYQRATAQPPAVQRMPSEPVPKAWGKPSTDRGR